MHSKDLIELQDSEGYIDITNVLALRTNENDHYLSANFKTDDGVCIYWKPSLLRSATHFGEVVASHIARQFGLRSPKYFFAKCKGVKGVISRDYKNEDEIEILGRDFLIDYYKETHKDYSNIIDHDKYNNIEFINKALKHSVETNKMSKNDAIKILENLLKTAMFDIAIQNPDRHHKNWALLKSEKGTRLAPVFDNGHCFNLHKAQIEPLGVFNSYMKNPSNRNLLKVEEYFKKEDAKLMPALGILPEEEKHKGIGKPYLKVLEEFKEMFPALFNEQLKNLYSIHFSKAFNSVEKETGVVVPQLLKNVVLSSYEERYNQIQKHFGQTKDDSLEEDKNLIF